MKRILVAGGILLIVLAAAALAFLWWSTRPLPVLTVATWPGTYGHAQASALFEPYATHARVDVHIAQYDGGLAKLRRQVGSGSRGWDVADFELRDAEAACAEGLLEHLPIALPDGADGAPAARDFVPGAIGPCWVGSVVFSQAIAYAPDRFPGAKPATLADFFDRTKFPGPRALRRGAKFNLEMALLADGVPPGQIYPMLATEAGVTRALAKLDTLGTIVWWDANDPPVAMLRDGRAALATVLNGDIFDAATRGRPLGAIWDRQLYELDVFGIPKGDTERKRALDFIRYATGAERLARVADWVPYGPARRSAWRLVGKNPELGIAMAPYLPTSHFATAFAIDDAWWRAHGAEIAARWQAWLAHRAQE